MRTVQRCWTLCARRLNRFLSLLQLAGEFAALEIFAPRWELALIKHRSIRRRFSFPSCYALAPNNSERSVSYWLLMRVAMPRCQAGMKCIYMAVVLLQGWTC